MKRSILMSGLLTLTILLGAHASATAAGISASTLEYQTIVTFSTNQGDIHIGLFDDAAPYSVNNFLNNYVNTGAYNNSFFHRSINNFVIQGGGFTYDAATQVYDRIHSRLPIPLEYGILNERGTIAMARASAPNSATCQFFFNTVDNSVNLGPGGYSADGYAVFGVVLGIADGYAQNGMDIIDALAAMPIYNKQSYLGTSEFETLPLLNTYSGSGAIENYLLKINSATVTPPVGAILVIPEPATFSLLGLGAVGLLRRRHA